MADNIVLKATVRETVGTTSAVKQRNQGLMPAIMYGHGQGQGIRGMFKERVSVHLDFVEEDPLIEVLQAEGLGVGDEVDLVAPCGQIDPQLRCHRT